jgi:CO dehydrogenase nickel-insertion accessory protein CooC1
MAYDLSCFIVEPTERSIQVYKDYIKTAKEKNIYVIVNKICTKDDYDFVKKNISEEKILCSF